MLVVGCNAGTAATCRMLLAEGAQVTVATVELSTSVRDLAERGLILLDERADERHYDIVVRETRNAPQRSLPPDARGEVVLIGGGIGDPDLITVAGLKALKEADVIVYDRLAPLSLLQGLDAELIDVGKIPRGEFTPQERINEVLIAKAREGKKVARFKGGDSFVFGRGGEEWLACQAEGIPVRTIPGISSSIAAAELVGVPVTHRGLVQGFTVISGHAGPSDPRSNLDWSALAKANTTLVILMGVATLAEICDTLIAHGMSPQTPAITVADAGLPSQRQLRAPLAELARAATDAGLGAPAVTIIGEVAGLELTLTEHRSG